MGPVGLTVLNAHLGVASDMVCFCRRFKPTEAMVRVNIAVISEQSLKPKSEPFTPNAKEEKQT